MGRTLSLASTSLLTHCGCARPTSCLEYITESICTTSQAAHRRYAVITTRERLVFERHLLGVAGHLLDCAAIGETSVAIEDCPVRYCEIEIVVITCDAMDWICPCRSFRAANSVSYCIVNHGVDGAAQSFDPTASCRSLFEPFPRQSSDW